MAYPETELNNFRDRMTRLTDSLNYINDVLAPVEGAGTTDAQRVAFFADAIAAAGDISQADVSAAVLALRDMQTWVDTNLPTLYKLRR